jgi:hypothetical protein
MTTPKSQCPSPIQFREEPAGGAGAFRNKRVGSCVTI